MSEFHKGGVIKKFPLGDPMVAGNIEILYDMPQQCNSGPHPPVKHEDEIELMEVDDAPRER